MYFPFHHLKVDGENLIMIVATYWEQKVKILLLLKIERKQEVPFMLLDALFNFYQCTSER